MPKLIYKIVPQELWRTAESRGAFEGAAIDLQDGFIHFSTADQVADTAALHFSGQSDLLLVAVDGATLGDALRYEQSRGSDLFPHLYGLMPMECVLWVKPMPLGDNNKHILPDLD
ncbi:MAG: DUF952 domain-containing protein [Hyphomicrobiales bacterium]|nr:DUF952 domain-containing protein [Hyphomicrobiales bacterium]MCP4997647.1 DUF952 domain-containing protein [Hyphomicrobiales bacterium]